MQAHSEHERVQFGRFELDRADGEVYRDGKPIRMQEHPRQVLIALLERPGEIVTREDLRERLWKSDTFVDFEHGLNTAVKKARQALGDSADAPEFIETLARKGYRFVGHIEPIQRSDPAVRIPAADNVERPGTPDRPRSTHRLALWGVGLVLLLTSAAAAWLALPRATPPDLAVLPFDVLLESGDAQYLGVGIADAIASRLANIGQIKVRPTSAVLHFKDLQGDPARLASTLGVSHLLSGTIQPAELGVRLSLQLVDAQGVVVHTWSIDEPATGVVQLQDRIAEEVVERLRVRLTPPERARLHVRYTDNPDAYDLYLRGRSLLVTYNDEAKMHKAIGYFQQALRLDENYALARAGLATASAWLSVRYAHEQESLVWGKQADEEARRALEQDGSLADAHFAIASAAGTEYGGYNWEVVLDRTATALALDRGLDLAHLARMRVYYHLGLFDEARREGRLAQALNPGHNVEFERLEIAALLFTGEYSSAVERATAEMSRTGMPAVRHYLGLARYYAGDEAGARATLASIDRNGRPDIRAQASLASIEAAVGMRNEARERLNDILRGGLLDHHTAYSVGAALVGLGDLNAGLDWLDRAATTGFPCYPWFQLDPQLDPLRRHPGFVLLLDRLRKGHEQARHRAR